MRQQQFIERATEVGAQLHVAANRQEAVDRVVAVFQSAGARLAVVSPDLGELKERVARALVGAGARLVEDPSPQAVAQADLGVTGAALAVAESGSIVLAGNDLLPRLASMLPLIHVAIVEARFLVPSLDDAAEFLRRAALRTGGEAIRYVSLVSGPSRTADVEKTLSTGVHGPQELHIILVQTE